MDIVNQFINLITTSYSISIVEFAAFIFVIEHIIQGLIFIFKKIRGCKK